MVKANIKPIFNTDMTILRTLYSFLLFFLCFSIKKFVQSKEKKHVLLEFFFFFLRFLVIEIVKTVKIVKTLCPTPIQRYLNFKKS